MQAATTHSVVLGMRFSVRAMTARDELILKTMVQALNKRFQSQGKTSWTYTAANDNADLHIIGDSLLPKTPLETPSASVKSVLMVVHTPHAKHPYVLLPLRADELSIELEKLASSASLPTNLKKPGIIAPLPSATTRAHSVLAQSAEPIVLGDLDVVRLTQWPPMALLKSPNCMKIATVMNGRAINIKNIQTRTGVAAAECQQFFAALQAAGILQIQPGTSRPILQPISAATGQMAVNVKPPAGLLSRIRLRLGL